MVHYEDKAGTWRQGLKQRPWRSAAYWLDSCGLLNLLFYTTQERLPRGGTVLSGLCSPTLNINQEMFHRCDYRPIWWDVFPTKILSSNFTLVCVKMTENQPTHPFIMK